MKKRQRKKRLKKQLPRHIMGIDLSKEQDFTVMADTTARFIYNKFNIPIEYMDQRADSMDLLYKEFLRMHRIVLKG